MKVIVAGSRTIEDMETVEKAIAAAGYDVVEIVSGMARGVDTIAVQWAQECKIPVAKFPADWDKFGKSAGYRRNVQMADYADALVAVWDGVSRGTGHMIDIMRLQNKPVFIYKVEK